MLLEESIIEIYTFLDYLNKTKNTQGHFINLISFILDSNLIRGGK